MPDTAIPTTVGELLTTVATGAANIARHRAAMAEIAAKAKASVPQPQPQPETP